METNVKSRLFYSTAEVAALLGISTEAVFKRIVKGQLPAQKVGRNYIIAKDVVDMVTGRVVSRDQNREIASVVKRAVKQYGETFRRLGEEE